ncbi:hypothetical protein PHAMO_260006 [Magnetospirillum molischianum DSM 120]|uniref:Uncharacterized protein n=1 Tax=Magnetospirillum molischianum DSM 120 TaxID=1150626 RepID=H8FS01_MAGML|nr:hypothetical protein PHAMO_260006 [Magnetospirillum molischianum DSM 120]
MQSAFRFQERQVHPARIHFEPTYNPISNDLNVPTHFVETWMLPETGVVAEFMIPSLMVEMRGRNGRSAWVLGYRASSGVVIPPGNKGMRT